MSHRLTNQIGLVCTQRKSRVHMSTKLVLSLLRTLTNMAYSETEHHTLWYTNPEARLWTTSVKPTDAILAFHRSLIPDCPPTNLTELPSLASELGVARVFMKDESTRLGLTAFKILGASWGVFHTLCKRWNLDVNTTTVDQLRKLASEED